ncbi:MAG: hypothetical protein HFI70_03435 [Lachnospiraceae bacterium]|nr:hypothetical protein [Lachnospiraceae bacterium]
MRMSKKWIAVMLSVSMLVSSAGISVQAEELPEGQQQLLLEEADSTKEESAVQKESELAPEAEEKPEKVQGKEREPDKKPKTENSQQILTGELNFIIQENTFIQSPGMQNIAVSLGKENTAIVRAELGYQNSAGQEFLAEAAGIADNMVKFTMKFDSEAQTDLYELTYVRYEADGNLYQVNFAELGMEVAFGVNREADAEPDELLVDQEILQEVEANVVTLDEDGNVLSENSVEDVLEESQGLQRFSAERSSAAPSTVNGMVIMLDPGHDSTHAGARGNGCKEEEAVLKIAQYCKAELQKYAGITVYMTRTSNTCPNGGSSVDSGTCNAKRVELAVSKKANVYVSFHLNSSSSTSPSGAGVYYPNGSYRPSIGSEGRGLAMEIFKKLSALGLSTWAGGILIRNSEDNSLYPDGSLADYLGVIRRSKLAGIPAVLIEHAFLSNASDVNNFLNSEEKLKNLGVADAQGIAGYYGLSVGTGQPEIQWIQPRGSKRLRLSWSQVAGASSYQIYRSNSENGKYEKIAQLSGDKYDDEKVQPGVSYYYKICAVLSNGSKTPYSKVYAGKSLAAPAITGIISKGGGKLNVKWNTVEGVQNYELLRSDTLGGSYKKIASMTENTYMDQNVVLEKNYFYKVRARGGDKNGYSSYSNVLSGWAVPKTSITSVSSKTSTSLLIRWKKVKNAYAYRIQRATSKKGKYKTIATVKNGGNSYIDTNVRQKKTYYYKVQVMNRVNNKTGYSSYCSAASGSTITGTSLSYVRSKSSGKMEIKWKREPSAYAYSIKRSTKRNGEYTKIAEIRDRDITEYVDKGVKGGTKYYYVVEVIIKKKGVRNYSGDSKPKAATNLKKISINSLQAGNEGITLSWDKAAGANTYVVMRSTMSNSGFQQIAKIKNADYTTFTDKNVTAGARYYYRVRAIREGKHAGYGSYGKVAEKWMLAAPKGLKITPVKQTVTPDTPAQMQLQWEKVKGASGYMVLKSTKEKEDYEMVAMINGNGSVSYKDSKVNPGTVYYYKVAAVGTIGAESGNGDETAPVSAMIPAAKK